MNRKENIDEWIDRALHDEQGLPEGLSDRLEQHLDALARQEETAKKRISLRRRITWAFSAGAAALLLLSILIFRPQADAPLTVADTFTDPNEAALATEQALGFLSSKFNEGLGQVASATQEIERAKEILTTHLQ